MRVRNGEGKSRVGLEGQGLRMEQLCLRDNRNQINLPTHVVIYIGAKDRIDRVKVKVWRDKVRFGMRKLHT